MSITTYWVIIEEHDNTNRVAFERGYATEVEALAMQSDLKSVGIKSTVKLDTIEVA